MMHPQMRAGRYLRIAFICVLILLISSFAYAGDGQETGPVGQYRSIFLADENGSINANGDYSSSPLNFTFAPEAGEVVRIGKLLIEIEDLQINSEDDYGGITGGLTNGFDIHIVMDGVHFELSGENNGNIKKNSDWHGIAYDVEYFNTQGGDDFINVRWRFREAGTFIRLVGDRNDSIYVTFNDDLTQLVSHKFLIKGYTELPPEESEMSFIGFILGFIGIGLLAFYAAFHIKSEEVPIGRYVEKSMLYALGFFSLMGIGLLMVIQADNFPALSYLSALTNNWFTAVVLASSASLFFFMLYVVIQAMKHLDAKKEKKERDE